MKRILVPTDFSKCAAEALKAAILVAKKLQAEIHLLHLMDIPVDWVYLDQKGQQALYPDITTKVKFANNELSKLAKEIEDHGVESHYCLEYNGDYRAILEFSNSLSADLIVMGTQGATGLKELIVGSVAQKVVRLSKCPVLTIEHMPSSFKMDHMVLATDLTPDRIDGFKKVVDLAAQFQSKLHMVFVNTPVTFTETKELKAKLRLYLREAHDLEMDFTVYNTYDFEHGLRAFCMETGDVLAMITRGKNGDLTQTMVNHMAMPILSMPA